MLSYELKFRRLELLVHLLLQAANWMKLPELKVLGNRYTYLETWVHWFEWLSYFQHLSSIVLELSIPPQMWGTSPVKRKAAIDRNMFPPICKLVFITSSYICLHYPHLLTKCCTLSTFDWRWDVAQILHAIGYALGVGIHTNHFNCVQGAASIITPNNQSVVILKQKKLLLLSCYHIVK